MSICSRSHRAYYHNRKLSAISMTPNDVKKDDMNHIREKHLRIVATDIKDATSIRQFELPLESRFIRSVSYI